MFHRKNRKNNGEIYGTMIFGKIDVIIQKGIIVYTWNFQTVFTLFKLLLIIDIFLHKMLIKIFFLGIKDWEFSIRILILSYSF